MTVSQATKFLEDAFDALNKEYFESALPKPIITIQTSPKAYGHFTTKEVWTDHQRKTQAHEINIGAEALDRPIAKTIATLVHEMVHYYCHITISKIPAVATPTIISVSRRKPKSAAY